MMSLILNKKNYIVIEINTNTSLSFRFHVNDLHTKENKIKYLGITRYSKVIHRVKNNYYTLLSDLIFFYTIFVEDYF